ncbi:mitochondrial fission process protein 1 isoform X2 [Labrus mixtus]|uniref:mitochondrial fission process protein 1 isoform X2 n=1 Tax=Labrus mixtus TaxID=508554 RepID=UPI0029BFAEAA|nr:mitochondrial fission process protein 1 isoform X2 [Labrus mixtus]
MFVLIFVFLALLATSSSSAQPGFPRYVQGRWVIADEKPAYEETEEQSQAVEDAVWSNNLMEDVQLVTPSDQDLQTTPDSSATQAQEEHSQAVEDAVWPNPNNNPMEDVQLVTPSDQDLQTTPDSSAIQAQELDKVEKTAAWKVVLVVSILLVSLVGSVSMAYYYCVWRGGRIHYQAQKEGFS